jgi:hypothetical protein
MRENPRKTGLPVNAATTQKTSAEVFNHFLSPLFR